jgi:hypothetical protein
MTEELRKQVYQTLLARSNNGKLHKKDTQIVAEQFDLHIRSVRRVWRRGKTQLQNGVPVEVGSLKKGRVGRKPTPVDLEVLRDVPLKDRMTLEDVCARLNISKWKLIRYLRQGKIRRHSSSLKPFLTPANRKTRMQFCIDMIKRGVNGDARFRDFFDFVHIDEKWFYLYQKSERVYLLPEEDDPIRTCKNKNYIPRLMFITVVARPRFRDGECIFDGKIGCFPFVTYEPAMRGNAATGRVRGDLIMKPIQNITRDVIRDFMINKILPAIRAKWPREDVRSPIYIQQDNAPTHLKVDDPLFCEAAKQHGFDFRIISQPPNSPDFNILDLGFFRAIQTIQYKKNARTIQELVPAVQEVKHLSMIFHIFHDHIHLMAAMFFVGIHGVLSTQSKSPIFNITNCFVGINEEERKQRIQNPSHEQGGIRKSRHAAY